MVGCLAKKAPPKATLTGFGSEQLELKTEEVLKSGLQDVLLIMPDAPEPIATKVSIEGGLDDQKLYWAVLEDTASPLMDRIRLLFPEPELPPEEPAWTEKRERPRMDKVLGIMAKDIRGFKTVSHDLHEDGVRIVVEQEMLTGQVIPFHLDLDDARIEPMELQGEVKWCGPRTSADGKPVKGFWIGVKFKDMSPAHATVLSRFLESSRNIEHGVITRDYE